MPISARFLPTARTRPHRVAALCLDGVVAFDRSVPAEVFSLAWERCRPLYEFTACAPSLGALRTTTGFEIAGVAGHDAVAAADTVIVPGYRAVFDPPPAKALEAL